MGTFCSSTFMILHGNPGGMHFSRAVPGRDWAHRGQLKARRHQKMLEVFSDASYGANADHRSIQGLVVCYAGVPIAWQCGAWHIQQQRRSSLPTANHWLLGKPRKLCYVLSGGRASTATPLIEQSMGIMLQRLALLMVSLHLPGVRDISGSEPVS